MTVGLRFEFLADNKDFSGGASFCRSFGVLCLPTLDGNIFPQEIGPKEFKPLARHLLLSG